MNIRFSTQTEELVEIEVDEFLERDLIVFNDDINSFDHVIDTLIKVCKHTQEQAEQCTLIIHHNGKCSVKRGSFEKLQPMRSAICDRGISAEIL